MKPLLALLTCTFPLIAFDHIDNAFIFKFGDPDAPTKVVEYMAFDCPNCIEDLCNSHQLKELNDQFIQSGDVEWSFHPDPSDLFTVQVLAAFEQVPISEKSRVFWELVSALGNNSDDELIDILESVICMHYPPNGDLKSIEYLRTTNAFAAARQYLSQKGIPRTVPTLEIDGQQLHEYPTSKVIKRAIQNVLQVKHNAEGAMR